MTRPKPGRQRPLPARPGKAGDVVALSPFRAELGRGRRLRRAEALYEAPDLTEAVRALPGDELYYVLHEVGLNEGTALLVRATPEQLQVALDFALWQRDHLDDAPLAEWLEAMSAAPFETVGAWLAGLDTELLALVLRRRCQIHDLTQEGAPDEPQGTLYPTPDGLFALEMRGGLRRRGDEGPDEAAVTIRLVDAFYRADADLARRILVGARAELDSSTASSTPQVWRWTDRRKKQRTRASARATTRSAYPPCSPIGCVTRTARRSRARRKSCPGPRWKPCATRWSR